MSAVSAPCAVGDRAAWIEEHKVRWRLGPFSEHVKDRGVVQTGYELVLSGRFTPSSANEIDVTPKKGEIPGEQPKAGASGDPTPKNSV